LVKKGRRAGNGTNNNPGDDEIYRTTGGFNARSKERKPRGPLTRFDKQKEGGPNSGSYYGGVSDSARK